MFTPPSRTLCTWSDIDQSYAAPHIAQAKKTDPEVSAAIGKVLFDAASKLKAEVTNDARAFVVVLLSLFCRSHCSVFVGLLYGAEDQKIHTAAQIAGVSRDWLHPLSRLQRRLPISMRTQV
jgi:hypothetical protein